MNVKMNIMIGNYNKTWDKIITKRDKNVKEVEFYSVDKLFIFQTITLLTSGVDVNTTPYSLIDDLNDFTKTHPHIMNISALKKWVNEADENFKLLIL